MAEMGKLESYKQAHNCWQYDISELSSEHIFSRQFLEISSESMSHKTREKLAKHWETQQLSPEKRNLWADHISISRRVANQNRLFVCRLAQSSRWTLYASNIKIS